MRSTQRELQFGGVPIDLRRRLQLGERFVAFSLLRQQLPLQQQTARILWILLQQLFDHPVGVTEVTAHRIGLRQSTAGCVGSPLRPAQLLKLWYRAGRTVSQEVEIRERERRGP